MRSPQNIADETGLNYRTVLRAIDDGELAAYKLRGRLRVSDEDFEAWLAASRYTPDPLPTIRDKVATLHV